MQNESAAVRVRLQVATCQQMTEDLLPVTGWQTSPYAKDLQAVMLGLTDPRRVAANENIDEMLHAAALATAVRR